MKRIRWTADAKRSYQSAIDHNSEQNASSSKYLTTRVRRVLDLASKRPLMFRSGRVPETREAVAHPYYIVVYRIEATAIVVVAFVHARQKYP